MSIQLCVILFIKLHHFLPIIINAQSPYFTQNTLEIGVARKKCTWQERLATITLSSHIFKTKALNHFLSLLEISYIGPEIIKAK